MSEAELEACQNMVRLFHQTSRQNWDSIKGDNKMNRGPGGLAGPGIYFATTADDTNHKAMNRGVTLEIPVCLGRTKTISPKGDKSITYRGLKREGYDSVKIPRSGDEYVVYSWRQVKVDQAYVVREESIQIHLYSAPEQYHPSGWCIF